MKLLLRCGFLGGLRLLRDWFHTRLFFHSARLVRRPVYIRGKSNILFGHSLTTGVGLRIDAFPLEQLGQGSLEIGNNV